jgi:hypothetical protein
LIALPDRAHPAHRRRRAASRRTLETKGADLSVRLFAQLTAPGSETRRFGTLHAARPLRADGSMVKAAAPAQR